MKTNRSLLNSILHRCYILQSVYIAKAKLAIFSVWFLLTEEMLDAYMTAFDASKNFVPAPFLCKCDTKKYCLPSGEEREKLRVN